jgi:hypothetical protein
MKFTGLLRSVVLNGLCVSVLASTTPVTRYTDPVGPLELLAREPSAAAPVSSFPNTNAQRFASGLPPLKPRRFHNDNVVKRATTSPRT